MPSKNLRERNVAKSAMELSKIRREKISGLKQNESLLLFYKTIIWYGILKLKDIVIRVCHGYEYSSQIAVASC